MKFTISVIITLMIIMQLKQFAETRHLGLSGYRPEYVNGTNSTNNSTNNTRRNPKKDGANTKVGLGLIATIMTVVLV